MGSVLLKNLEQMPFGFPVDDGPFAMYRINGYPTSPLVEVSQLKGHLALLRHFAALRTTVDGLKQSEMSVWHDQMPEDRELRWTWFVGRAVERFERWCQSLMSDDTEAGIWNVLPPLDALMVWHSYMLNPGPIRCLKCLKTLEAPLMKEDGTGYLQQNFILRCPAYDCQTIRITKETLALYKLSSDIVRTEPRFWGFLAGTLRTSMSDLNIGRATNVKDAILLAKELKEPPGSDKAAWIQSIMKNVNYQLMDIRKCMTSKVKGGDGRL
ncbi:hypothetical protein DXG03_008453 [Asterophora parasitica]|uniref:Uncharacterized protein n=1 Tax=Asterophora parasitica TaxID=117018 RepID=A0A9P7KGE0_9AGAR|nr:hypothetical protein DXG03_008453 [Asterophora parasitica]